MFVLFAPYLYRVFPPVLIPFLSIFFAQLDGAAAIRLPSATLHQAHSFAPSHSMHIPQNCSDGRLRPLPQTQAGRAQQPVQLPAAPRGRADPARTASADL